MEGKKSLRYEDIIKDMTEEELERYEEFIKPKMEMNERKVERILEKKPYNN